MTGWGKDLRVSRSRGKEGLQAHIKVEGVVPAVCPIRVPVLCEILERHGDEDLINVEVSGKTVGASLCPVDLREALERGDQILDIGRQRVPRVVALIGGHIFTKVPEVRRAFEPVYNGTRGRPVEKGSLGEVLKMPSEAAGQDHICGSWVTSLVDQGKPAFIST